MDTNLYTQIRDNFKGSKSLKKIKNYIKSSKKLFLKFEFQVSCLMDANPASELTFKWKFNTTANTVDIPVRILNLKSIQKEKKKEVFIKIMFTYKMLKIN